MFSTLKHKRSIKNNNKFSRQNHDRNLKQGCLCIDLATILKTEYPPKMVSKKRVITSVVFSQKLPRKLALRYRVKLYSLAYTLQHKAMKILVSGWDAVSNFRLPRAYTIYIVNDKY